MSESPAPSPAARNIRPRPAAALRRSVPEMVPGLVASALLAALGLWLQAHAFARIGALAWTLAAACLLAAPARALPALGPGLRVAAGPLLRLTVTMMGALVTFDSIAGIGGAGLAIALVPLAATFGFTMLLGRLFMRDTPASVLIAMGSSVCGASAILAANSVAAARPAQVAAALGAITLIGSLGMIALPLLAAPLGLDARQLGLWAGAALQEVAQVAAAAAEYGDDSLGIATATKMARVLCLAPLLFCLSLFLRGAKSSGDAAARPPAVPWFLVGFLVVAAANSAGLLPAAAVETVRMLMLPLLGMAIAAIGLRIDLRGALASGGRMLLVASAASAFIAGLSLTLAIVLGPR